MARMEIYRFADFTLDVTERRLLRCADVVRLSPKAFDVLVVLVREHGHLVRKDDLLQRVWPESFVEEGILTVHVSALRKALGDISGAAYIETVPRSGYRFIGAVARGSADADASAVRAVARPVELYELVGRGRSHLLSGSYFEVPDAVAAFRAAIAIDRRYAPAHAGLALARCAEACLRAAPYHEAFAEAKKSALKALAMDNGDADALVALGTVLFLSDWDWVAAEHSLRRALDINKDHTEALLQYGSLQEALGRLDAGLQFKQRALARDPASALVLVQIAISHWHRRDYDETVVWAQRALDVDPKHMLAGEFLLGVYWKLDDLNRWLAESRRRAIVFGASDEALAQVDRAAAEMRRIHASGGHAALVRFMADLVTAQARAPGAAQKAALQCAVLCGAAGRLDDAFEGLDRALMAHDPALVHLAVAPQWDSLRVDPRFAERLRSMALPCAVA
jgi:DNA-binding winged helix-turn-helix (wHTH) protein